MNNNKGMGVVLALSLFTLAGCNTDGANTELDSGSETFVGVGCEYTTYSEAEAVDSHRLKVQIPEGQCIGEQDINIYRKILPLEIGVPNPDLRISDTVKVYGGSQPTYVFTVTNISDTDLCFIKLEGLAVLDSSGSSLIDIHLDFLGGDSFSSSSLTTSTCLAANSSGVIAHYLEYEPVDLSSAERIHIDSLSAKDIGGEPVPSPELEFYDWAFERETTEIINRTGKAIDLDDSSVTIEYFDQQGYLIASLFMHPATSGEFVDINDSFRVYKGRFNGAKVTEVHLVFNFDYVDQEQKSRMIRSSEYFELADLKQMQRDLILSQESLF